MKLDRKTYEINIAGLIRELLIVQITDNMAIASFVLLGDSQLVLKAAAELLPHLPEVDYLITAEAKGIPLAMGVAKLFDRPLVVVRKESKMTEGSVVTINYISGSSKRIQTMSLAKRAVSEGQKTIIIDDFIAGGGTVRAIFEMMKEFSITLLGCGAAISTRQPERKRIENYKSLMTLEEVNEEAQKLVFTSNI